MGVPASTCVSGMQDRDCSRTWLLLVVLRHDCPHKRVLGNGLDHPDHALGKEIGVPFGVASSLQGSVAL